MSSITSKVSCSRWLLHANRHRKKTFDVAKQLKRCISKDTLILVLGGSNDMTEQGRKLNVKARSCKSIPPPKWIRDIGYDAFVWVEHYLRCKVRPLGYSWPQSNSYTGGNTTYSTEWADPPVGPPCSRRVRIIPSFGKYTWAWLAAMQRDKGLSNERSTRSDRMESRSDIGGNGPRFTDRHGGTIAFPQWWGGPPWRWRTALGSSHDQAACDASNVEAWM